MLAPILSAHLEEEGKEKEYLRALWSRSKDGEHWEGLAWNRVQSGGTVLEKGEVCGFSQRSPGISIPEVPCPALLVHACNRLCAVFGHYG